jgi:hypothetical protein
MSSPVIFTISAAWDQEASVWSGHCDDIPAAADAPTLDELLEKISAMALDFCWTIIPMLLRNRCSCRSPHKNRSIGAWWKITLLMREAARM